MEARQVERRIQIRRGIPAESSSKAFVVKPTDRILTGSTKHTSALHRFPGENRLAGCLCPQISDNQATQIDGLQLFRRPDRPETDSGITSSGITSAPFTFVESELHP